MKGTLALITVLISLAAPIVAAAAASSAPSGGGGGASHAGGGGGFTGGAGHAAGPSVGSASHATAAHATAAHALAHVTATRVTNVKMATLARVDAAKPKLPPKTAPTGYRGEPYPSWETAVFYCADRDYSLGGLANSCSRASKSSGRGG